MKTNEVGNKLILTWEKEDEIKVGETITIDLEEIKKEAYKDGFTTCQKLVKSTNELTHNQDTPLKPLTRLELIIGKINWWIYLHLTKKGREYHKKLKENWKLNTPQVPNREVR